MHIRFAYPLHTPPQRCGHAIHAALRPREVSQRPFHASTECIWSRAHTRRDPLASTDLWLNSPRFLERCSFLHSGILTDTVWVQPASKHRSYRPCDRAHVSRSRSLSSRFASQSRFVSISEIRRCWRSHDKAFASQITPAIRAIARSLSRATLSASGGVSRLSIIL